MILNTIDINSSKVSVRKPQIYIICVLKPKPVVYVGQTCQKNGILGRFFQHMTEGGTLTQIMWENEIYEFEDISVMAVDLSEYGIFDDVYNRKREALEFIIQREMKVEGCKSEIPFRVLSRVFYNSEVANHKIDKLAKQIVKKIITQIPFNERKM